MLAEKLEEGFKPRDLAEQALKDSDGDVEKAVIALEQMCRDNPSAWMAMTERRLSESCYDECRKLIHSERRQIWTAPNYDPAQSGERVKTHAKSIMDLPLPGGKLLKNASREDLAAASDFYRKQAATMAQLSQFFWLVRDKVEEGRTVAECADAALLEEIKESVVATEEPA